MLNINEVFSAISKSVVESVRPLFTKEFITQAAKTQFQNAAVMSLASVRARSPALAALAETIADSYTSTKERKADLISTLQSNPQFGKAASTLLGSTDVDKITNELIKIFDTIQSNKERDVSKSEYKTSELYKVFGSLFEEYMGEKSSDTIETKTSETVSETLKNIEANTLQTAEALKKGSVPEPTITPTQTHQDHVPPSPHHEDIQKQGSHYHAGPGSLFDVLSGGMFGYNPLTPRNAINSVISSAILKFFDDKTIDSLVERAKTNIQSLIERHKESKTKDVSVQTQNDKTDTLKETIETNKETAVKSEPPKDASKETLASIKESIESIKNDFKTIESANTNNNVTNTDSNSTNEVLKKTIESANTNNNVTNTESGHAQTVVTTAKNTAESSREDVTRVSTENTSEDARENIRTQTKISEETNEYLKETVENLVALNKKEDSKEKSSKDGSSDKKTGIGDKALSMAKDFVMDKITKKLPGMGSVLGSVLSTVGTGLGIGTGVGAGPSLISKGIEAAKGLGTRGIGSVMTTAGKLAGYIPAIGAALGTGATALGSTIAGAATAAAPALGAAAGIGAAGIGGYVIGDKVVIPLINKGIETLTGDKGATLGTWLSDFFGSSKNDEIKAMLGPAPSAKIEAAQKTTGEQINQLNAVKEKQDAATEKASANPPPIVVNTPPPVSSGTSNTSNYVVATSVRNNESTFERVQMNAFWARVA